MSLVERCYVSISNKLRRHCTRTSNPARVKTTLVETLCGFRHAPTWGLLRPVAGATLHALSSTSDGDLPRNRVQSHFMADIQATNLMTSECSLSRRPIQLNYSIVQTSVIVYNDTQIYSNLNLLIDDSSGRGSHRGLIVYITMTTFPAYHEHLSCETSWPILGREDPTNTQVGVGMSRTTDKVFTVTFYLPLSVLQQSIFPHTFDTSLSVCLPSGHLSENLT